MKNRFLEKLTNIYKDKAFRKKLHRIFLTLAAIVVFTTSYALILPAITVEKDKAIENNIPIHEAVLVEETGGATGQAEFMPVGEENPEIGTGPELGPVEARENVPGSDESKPGIEQAEDILDAGLEAGKEERPELGPVVEEDLEAAIKEEIKQEESQREAARRTLDFTYNRRGLQGRVKVINTNLPEDAVLKISPIKEKEEVEIRPMAWPLMERQLGTMKALGWGDEAGRNQGENGELGGMRPVPKLDLEDLRTTDPLMEELILEEERDREFLDLFLLEEIRTLDEKTRQIEEAIEGDIEDILYFDISFFTPEGEYLEVGEEARITMDLSGENLTRAEGEEIAIGHFTKDQLVLLDAQVQIDEDNRVEEISFDTEGFSVFAVIKIGSWKEASLPEDEYTIITSIGEGKYVSASNPSAELVGKLFSYNEDTESRPGGDGTPRPRQFINLDVRNKYDRFFIEEESATNRTYTIRNRAEGYYDTEFYLSVDGGNLVFDIGKFTFKFYKNSKEPDKLMIFAYDRSNNNKPYILVYDQNDNNYKFINSYDLGAGQHPYHQFVKNRRDLVYKKLTGAELANLQAGQYAIIPYEHRRRDGNIYHSSLNNVVVPQEFDSPSVHHFDSIGLRKEGNLFYTDFDPARGNRWEPAHLWTISPTSDKPNQYFIQDEEGKYLHLVSNTYFGNFGYLEMVDQANISPEELAEEKFRFETTQRPNGTIEFTNLPITYGLFRQLSLNIASANARTAWHAYQHDNVTNNYQYLARLTEDSIKDEVTSTPDSGPDLIEAIVPDGDYYITDRYANFALNNNDQTENYLKTHKSEDRNNILWPRDGEDLGENCKFHIRRENDGTYRITKYGSPGDLLQITNKQYGSYEYKRIYLKSRIEQVNSQNIRIATIENDPNLFYIYTDFGSLQFYPWANNNDFGTSIVGDLGQPLRLYKITNTNNDNQRFSHQGGVPGQETEKLAHIPDGDYVLGNSPNIQDSIENENKQAIQLLQVDGSALESNIYYNEKANNLDQFHTIEDQLENEIDKATEWSLSQTEIPGHYTIESAGNYLDISSGSITTSTTGQEFTIYKNESQPDQVLLVQGAYRLRFDQANTAWTAVPNSEPLTEADYHYIGKKIDDYLSFKLTNPDTEKRLKAAGTDDINTIGGENSWLNNVRLMEKVWVRDLEGNLGTNKPKGEFENLGPIGQAYEKRYSTNQPNPYKGLYRIGLNKEDLDASITTGGNEAANYIRANHYKEYDFLGWKFESSDGKTYIIDKNQGAFTSDETGIIIPAGQSKILGTDGNLTDNPSQLAIPYKSTLETYWQELSAPIYFKYIHQKGIMDIERAMSAKTLLDREPDNISPILGAGRLFFPEYKAFDFAGTRAETMDRDLGRRFQSIYSLDFSGDSKNQINMNYFAHVETSTGTTVNNTVIFDKNPQPLGKNAMEGDAIDWLREANGKLSIIRFLENNGELELVENIKKDKNTINYGINLLDIQENASGNFLKGIVYAKTTEVQIEKDFEGLADEDIDNLLQAHINSAGTTDVGAFNLKLKIDNQVFYQLPASKDPDNTIASGPNPLTYEELEKLRVHQTYDEANKTFSWFVKLPLGQEFTVLEENFDLKDYFAPAGQVQPKYDIFTRLQEYKLGQGNPTDKFGTFPYGTASSLESDLLNSDENKYVRFNNLYANGGLVLLSKKGEQTGQMIRGIEFKLYRADDTWVKEAQPMVTGVTGNNGNIVFRNLAAGKYILEETKDANSIYQDIDDFKFTIVTEPQTDGSVFYKLVRQDQPVDPAIVVDSDSTNKVNKLQVTNKLKSDTLIIEKNFKGIVRSELDEVFKTFKIQLEGKHNGQTYTKTLTHDNANIANYSNSVTWYVNALDLAGQDSVSIVDFEKVIISETGYEHGKYPVVKRRAWFNGVERDIVEYPYEIEPIKDKPNKFKLDNIYTDTFEMVIEVYGRDKEYSHHIPVKDMGFQVYGSLDEANHNVSLQELLVGGKTFYLLEKPQVEFSTELKTEFKTDSDGYIKSIYNLGYIKDNEYVLYQKTNPATGLDVEGRKTVYYPIGPITITLEGEGANLKPVVSWPTGQTIQGEKNATYSNGLLYIQFKLDRTNYRLPETGGIGTNSIKKLALVMIGLTATSLIYRRRKYDLKGEKK